MKVSTGQQTITVTPQGGETMNIGSQQATVQVNSNQTLYDNNKTLAATNAQLVDEILPAFRGGLQTKEVAPADIEQVITPDDGYLGLQRVKVAPYEREVQVVNRRANESEILYYMEDIATQYQRSDYAVCMAGEFFKYTTTTILAGADAYLTSDGDFYDAQTTHTWHDYDDMHANRWVVYYFKDGENRSNFTVADNAACPYTLAVKGHLGAIISNYQSNIGNIIVPDGSSVLDLRFSAAQPNMSTVKMYVKNVLRHTAGYILMDSRTVVFATSVIESSNYLFYSDAKDMIFYAPRLKNTSMPFNRRFGTYQSIYIPELESCPTITQGYPSSLLTKIDAPKLKYSYSDVSQPLISGPNLTEINIPLYEGVPAGYSAALRLFANISKIEEINLPNFKGDLGINSYHSYVVINAASLKRLILPNFILNASGSVAWGCPNLEYIYIPKTDLLQSESYDGNWIQGMSKLHTFVVGKFNQDGHWSGTGAFLNCPRLVHLEAAMTQNINVKLNKWAPTEALNDNTDLIEDADRCATNREQFFINFVELILHKLQDRTGSSKLTITLSQTVYDAIFSDESGFEYEGQPIGEYVTSYIAAVNWSVAIAS